MSVSAETFLAEVERLVYQLKPGILIVRPRDPQGLLDALSDMLDAFDTHYDETAYAESRALELEEELEDLRKSIRNVGLDDEYFPGTFKELAQEVDDIRKRMAEQEQLRAEMERRERGIDFSSLAQ